MHIILKYSTQEWHKNNPNDFNINNSLESKTFIMKMLLNKWKMMPK